MTFLSILETLLINPLKLGFEIIFETAYRIVGHPGIAIIFLSLTMNILVLPMYRRADAMQEETRDKEAKIQDGVRHIKKMFSGDERMMILQTYYRQNHYKPTDALNGSVSLLLEIPFFMGAYQFLSHLEILQNVSLGPIANLSMPDGLLVIGDITLNLLPILMTLINVISSTLYLKGFPLKTKIQLYGIALFFFVFLYASPAGLVFYWTLNNVFSLIKNIFYRLKNPKKVLKKRSELYPNCKLFLFGTVFLTILIGLLIPSAFIADSPQEYVDISYFHNPLWYIANSFCMAAGMFLIWTRVFYRLASPKGKIVFERLVWILCGITFVNYMFFGTDLGIISSSLQYENDMYFSQSQKLINFIVLTAVAIVLYLCACKWKHIVENVLVISIIALGVMSVFNLLTIKTSVDKISERQLSESDVPHFQLSQTGQNVIVIMLDRAMGEYIPYIFKEKPELEKQFAGFTYYENVISFGAHTNFGIPALLGGYEYTPIEMNKRVDEPLVSKHNEALKLMPVIFSENGYDVTVCDPPYANYQWSSDLSIYDDYSGISAYHTSGWFGDVEQKQMVINRNNRNFYCFSVMKSMPLFLQPIIYSHGRYYQTGFDSTEEATYSVQIRHNISLSDGIDASFMEIYYVLANLMNMTRITKSETDTFFFMTNDITHSPMLLQEPDYVPAQSVDNTEYDAMNTDRFIIEGRRLKMENSEQMASYHANMVAMLQLGNWFDYLREKGVYDNTRIILVSDHGYKMAQLDELILDDGSDPWKDVERYYPLLMVKDFNSEEFVISDTFMTNADVPTLAMENLIADPINPFTGKPINSDEKIAHDQFIIRSAEWSIEENNGNVYLPSGWASVKDNIWDRNNWTLYDELTVLDEYVAP